jgi:hypothetical protein
MRSEHQVETQTSGEQRPQQEECAQWSYGPLGQRSHHSHGPAPAGSHKTHFVALKRSIRAGLNLVDPLAHDGTNTGRRRDKIPSASALKRSNLLGHGKLPFRMTLSIPIRSRLKGNRKTILTRRVTISWTTTARRKRRRQLIRGRSIRRGSIQNMRATRIMEGKRRQR